MLYLPFQFLCVCKYFFTKVTTNGSKYFWIRIGRSLIIKMDFSVLFKPDPSSNSVPKFFTIFFRIMNQYLWKYIFFAMSIDCTHLALQVKYNLWTYPIFTIKIPPHSLNAILMKLQLASNVPFSNYFPSLDQNNY